MKNTHQGSMVQSWVEKKHDSINNFAVILSSDASEKDRIKTHSKFVNLLWGIAKQEVITQRYHKRWDNEIAPVEGITLQQVLKEVGEKEIPKSQDIPLSECQKQLYIMQGKYEAAIEANKLLISELKDIMLTLKGKK